MYQVTNNYLLRFGERCDSVNRLGRCAAPRYRHRPKNLRPSCLASVLLLTLIAHPLPAQKKSAEPLKGINAEILAMSRAQQQVPETPAKRSVTVADAVSIFLQQNLQLVAARYDIDLVDAEKLTARLRPNPQLTVGSVDLPLDFSGNFINQQTFSYGISQTFELGGKRRKRIDAASANPLIGISLCYIRQDILYHK